MTRAVHPEDRPPPHSPEAEQATLGAILLDSAAFPAVREIIGAGDFYATANRLVFETMEALATRGTVLDGVTVPEALRAAGKLKQAGGAAYLAGLTNHVPGIDAAAHYARIVRDHAARRRALGAALAAAQRLREDLDAEPAKLLGQVQEALAACSRVNGHRTLGIGARDLMALDLPAPSYVVRDLLPEGLSLLVGPPKLGKSWLALAVGVAVAQGGPALGGIQTERGPVLVLALEDSRRRVQTRLRMILEGEPAPEDLHVVTLEDGWPRPLPEGLADLAAYVRDHRPRLIVLDTLGRLRRGGNGRRDAYSHDVGELGPLQGLAQGSEGLAILAVHHTRKAVAADYLESASGSFGVVGTADAILTLTRARGEADAELRVTGRDVAERELALSFDPTRGAWTALGSAQEYRQSNERREIIEVLRGAQEALSPKEIAEALEKPAKHGSVKHLLRKLVEEGLVVSTGRGRYCLTHAGHLTTPFTPFTSSPRSPCSPGERETASVNAGERQTESKKRKPVAGKPAMGEQGERGDASREEVWQ